MSQFIARLADKVSLIAITLAVDTPDGPMEIHTWTTGPDPKAALQAWRRTFRGSRFVSSRVVVEPRERRAPFPSDYIPVGDRA